MKRYYYRIRNGYNGQVTEWQEVTESQLEFVTQSFNQGGLNKVETKVEEEEQ